MENEVPKTEVPEVKETVVEAVVEKKEEAVVASSATPSETPEKKKPTLKDVAQMVCGYVSKIDRTTKTFIVIFGIFGILFVGFVYFKGFFIAASVNGQAISRWSVVQELEKQSGKNVLDTMITKKLIKDELRKQGVVATPADVDAEVKKVEEQVMAQGGTLEQALAGQGMSLSDLREQIEINKSLEQLLADKISVSDEELKEYLNTTKMPASNGVSSEDMVNQAREQLKGRKFSTEATQWVSDLKEKAKIDYFVLYE